MYQLNLYENFCVFKHLTPCNLITFYIEEEIIVPGNEEEMTEFTNDAVEHSAVHLDFNLPILSLQIE